MDMTNYAQLIGTLGFPIVMCITLLYGLYKIIMYTITSKDDVIKNNTQAITSLAEKIENLCSK